MSIGASADTNILPVGDSITRGFAGQESYRVELVSRLNASACAPVTRGSQPNLNDPWPHEGYSGHRADHFLTGFAANPGIAVTIDRFSAPLDPVDVVLLHIGTNDMIWQQSVSSTLNEIDDIINIIKQDSPSSQIYLANNVPLYILFDTTGNNRLDTGTDTDGDGFYDVSNTEADALAAGIEANYANDPNVTVVDVRTGFRPTDMVPDGIHPSEDDASDPRSDSGEHHLAVAFAAALEDGGLCTPVASTDSSFPLTHILFPAVGDAISGSVTISGRAVDTGGAGFDRVRIAIQDNAFTSNSNRWWNFDSQQFGNFDSINAHNTQATTNYLEWRAGFAGDPGDSGLPINLPIGDFTVFALSIDNNGNQNYSGFELWPERTEFSVSNVGGGTCNGLEATVIIANGDTPTSGPDVILGTDGPDTIVAMGGNDTICGLGGNDDINGGRGNDWIDAGAGNDVVQGANDDDSIYGDNGTDTLLGGPGNDTIFGENGDDVIKGNSGDDTLSGDEGIDKISGGSGDDIIYTGTGSNVGTSQTVTGGNGNDTLFGGSDADEIRGEAGNDTITGGTGNDRLFGGAGEDDIDGEEGNDLVRGNAAADILRGGTGNDQVDGLGGKDVMYGGDGGDTLNGSTGNDTLFGERGNDVLNGGGGNDALNGGGGSDTCNGAGGTGDSASECETLANIP